MAALRDDGHTICDANLNLEIVSPSGDWVSVTVERSGQCGPDNVTDVPDYFAYYELPTATQRGTDAEQNAELTQNELITGIYQMKLTNLDNGYEIEDSFEVREWVPFDIERIGPTRIYPPAIYEMKIKIKVNQDFVGQVVESMPESFVITATSDKRQETRDGEKLIIWNVNWKTGEEYELKYQFDAPDISPYLYLLGPLRFEQ